MGNLLQISNVCACDGDVHQTSFIFGYCCAGFISVFFFGWNEPQLTKEVFQFRRSLVRSAFLECAKQKHVFTYIKAFL